MTDDRKSETIAAIMIAAKLAREAAALRRRRTELFDEKRDWAASIVESLASRWGVCVDSDLGIEMGLVANAALNEAVDEWTGPSCNDPTCEACAGRRELAKHRPETFEQYAGPLVSDFLRSWNEKRTSTNPAKS